LCKYPLWEKTFNKKNIDQNQHQQIYDYMPHEGKACRVASIPNAFYLHNPVAIRWNQENPD